MLYNNILIDTANLFYRVQKNDVLSSIKEMIKAVDEANSHLIKGGKIYLLFDPVSMKDFDESKSFSFSPSTRKVILEDYKANRTYSKLYKETIELFRKYYLYRGESFAEVYSSIYEADDYVKPLLKEFNESNEGKIAVALESTDQDWARYVQDTDEMQIEMINGPWDKPYTKNEFFETFHFMPTEAANTVYKAIYGDKSDNITGCLNIKKAKFGYDIKKVCFEMIQEISKSNMTLDEFIEKFQNMHFNQTATNAKVATIYEKVFSNFTVASLKAPVLETFFKNINVIRCAFDVKAGDHKKYVHNNPEKPAFNSVIEQSIYGKKLKIGSF